MSRPLVCDHFVPYVQRLQALIASANSDDFVDDIGSRTELDSHANMVVVGQNATIFDTTGKTCTVNSFSESAGKIEHVPIVDAVVAYD